MMQISILGCGWLGLPLAEKLIVEGFSVKGSTTSPEKIMVLENLKIKPFLLRLNTEEIEGDMNGFLDGSQILIIDIPPKIKVDGMGNFIAKMQNLIRFVENSKIRKVLFVSSTSVYGDNEGPVTEVTIPNPETESGRQLMLTEKLLRDNISFETTILRFGGLIGEDRHPVKHLAGKTNLQNPQMPVNLIHKEDCIGIISKIIEKESWGEIFNGVAPFHPSKAAYYTQKASKMNLPLPQFSKDNSSTGKVIGSGKVEKKLDYSFKLELY
jgi:nucleoside-diphosphate-sugar epimerase